MMSGSERPQHGFSKDAVQCWMITMQV